MGDYHVDRLPPVDSAWLASGREAGAQGRERAGVRKPPRPEAEQGDQPDESEAGGEDDERKAGFDGFA